MAQIVPIITEIVAPVATVIIAVGTANAVIRTVVVFTLQKFGAWNPQWDKKWPRLPWRPLWRAWIKFKEWHEEHFVFDEGSSASNASWITQHAMMHEEGQTVIGRVKPPYGLPYYGVIGESSERHVIIVAAPRSGKTQQLKVDLALMPDKCRALVLDPKCEITNDILIPLERRGHRLVCIDPFQLSNRPTQQINILAQIGLINKRTGLDLTTILCNRIATVTFPDNPSEKSFFIVAPRELWARLICFVLWRDPNATMMDVRKLLKQGFLEEANGDPKLAYLMLWEAMLECPIYDGYVSSTGAQMIEMDDKTKSNVLATAQAKTAFWDHEQIQSISRENDFDLCGLKDNDCTDILSLAVPVGELKTTLKPWAGSIISLALLAMEYIPEKLDHKTKFVLEEVQALGASALHGVSGQMALLPGYGAQITIVAHTISGLKAEFPNDWETMIGTAQQVIFMATNDEATVNFIERMALGSKTVKRRKWHIPFLWTVARYSKNIMDGDQLRRLLEADRENTIVLRNGRRTVIGKNVLSYKCLPIWMVNPSKDFGETPARAWFRGVWEEWQQKRSLDSSERVVPEDQAQPLDIEPEPHAEPEFVLSKAEAEAVFGLTEPYSTEEITARAKCLNDNFSPALINAAMHELEAQ